VWLGEEVQKLLWEKDLRDPFQPEFIIGDVPLRKEVDQLGDLRVPLLLHKKAMNFPRTHSWASRGFIIVESQGSLASAYPFETERDLGFTHNPTGKLVQWSKEDGCCHGNLLW